MKTVICALIFIIILWFSGVDRTHASNDVLLFLIIFMGFHDFSYFKDSFKRIDQENSKNHRETKDSLNLMEHSLDLMEQRIDQENSKNHRDTKDNLDLMEHRIMCELKKIKTLNFNDENTRNYRDIKDNIDLLEHRIMCELKKNKNTQF